MIYKMPTTYVLAYFSLKLGVGGGSWGGGEGGSSAIFILPFSKWVSTLKEKSLLLQDDKISH